MRKAILLILFSSCATVSLQAQSTGFTGSVTVGSTYFSERPLKLYTYGKGFSTHLEIDVGFDSEWLRLRFNPSIWAVQNKMFNRFPITTLTSSQITAYQKEFRWIDLPEHYGNTSYQQFYLGDSRLSIGPRQAQFGISSERRAWGAGERQQLLLSRNALGFRHAFIELEKVPLGIGSFSMTVIGGRLDSSGYARYPMPDEWRVISGVNLRVEPDFIPGLELGLIRIFVLNASQVKSFSDAFPFLQPFEKKSLGAGTDGSGSQPDNQLASVFFRWTFEPSSLLVYGEYAREDHSLDIRDVILQPEHMRGYVLGGLKRWDENEFGVELVNVTQVNPRSLRDSGWWYSHVSVRHGYTHLGQILGAEIGPGSRSQEVWLRSHTTELSLRRVDVDKDLFHDAFATGGYKPEVDWIFRLQSAIQKGRFTIAPEFSIRHTRNRFYLPKNHETSLGAGIQLTWGFNSAN